MPMMSYSLKGAYRVVKPGCYPWPLRCGGEPERTFELLADDILTKDEETGTYTCHTGIMCSGIVIPDDAVQLCEEIIHLQGI